MKTFQIQYYTGVIRLSLQYRNMSLIALFFAYARFSMLQMHGHLHRSTVDFLILSV